MRIRILSSGFHDLERGQEFYENQHPGLGDYFRESLFSDIDSLLIHASSHRKVFGYYRLLSNKFPYAIYYQIDSKDILIYRVLYCRENPDRLHQKLDI